MISINYVKYFFDAATHTSISKAAKINHVSQSAISQGIMKLEAEFGAMLIEHGKNRFRLTDKGIQCLEEARHLFEAVEAFEDQITSERTVLSGRLRIATTHSIGNAFLPRFLACMYDRYPLLIIDFTLDHVHNIQKLMSDQAVDFAISLDDFVFANTRTDRLFVGQYRVYRCPELDDSRDLPVYVRSLSSPAVQKFIEGHKKQFGSDIQLASPSSSWELLASMAMESLGYALLPEFVANKKRMDLMLSSKQVEGLDYAIHAVYPAQRRLRAAALAAIEVLKTLSI